MMLWHSLEKHLLHHVVQSAVQCRVIEKRVGRVQPAVEVHHLVVCINIVILRNLSDPSNHHALQDPARTRRGVQNKRQVRKTPKCSMTSFLSVLFTPERVGAESGLIIASKSTSPLVPLHHIFQRGLLDHIKTDTQTGSALHVIDML